MLKLMELSVGLRESGMVKEALHKYRAMCMQSNVASLEEVVRFLVDLSEKRTEEARKHVDENILEGAEDLEDGAMETPETLILEAAGNALTKERIDRQQVVPWMRFLWEVYRVVLDIVKTHNKLELCYHTMATRAFSFCVKYKRFMEFRRLCDMLRQHLSQLMNNPRASPNDVKISDSETLQKFMETRFTQLSTAVTLEHWQQAYRTIEDIHMIMTMGKAKAKPQHMSVYYDKLMQVFWVSGNYLYHAHALYKLYTLSIRQNRNLSAEDAQNMASRLLLAALSIPVYDAQSAVLSGSYGVLSDVLGTPTNDNASRHARMASLLGYSSAAERGPLISELLTKGVKDASHPELHDVYDLFEGEMAPLQFSDRFKKILSFVESHDLLKEYIVPLRRVAIFRLLEQLGRVYDVMRLEDMKKVASFTDYTEVEETALTALKTRSLAVRFDYQNQCLRFESELFSTDGMRKQLGRLARRMALTSKMLTENASIAGVSASENEVVALAIDKEKKTAARRKLAISAAKENATKEAKIILQRRDLIEKRKEEAERRTAEAVKQKKLAAARELARAEARRKQEEAKRREEEKEKLAKASIEISLGTASVHRTGIVGAQIVEGDAEREARMTREKEKELKEKAEFKKRVQQVAVHLNHMERALREEQWPLMTEAHVKESEEKAKLTKEIAAKELEDAKSHHARALEDKGRTTRVMPFLEQYLDDLMIRVDEDFDAWARKERDRAEAQAAREAELARQREEEEAKIRKEREEEERVAREEAERIEREEREAREAQEKKEAEERQQQEDRERQAREAREAAERAEREKKAAAAAPPPAPVPKPKAERYRPGMFGRGKVPSEVGSTPTPLSVRDGPSMGPRGAGRIPSFGLRDRSNSFGSRDSQGAGRESEFPISREVSASSRDSMLSREERTSKPGAYVPPNQRGSGGRPPSGSGDVPPSGPRYSSPRFVGRRPLSNDGAPGSRQESGFGFGPRPSSGGSDVPQRKKFYNSKLGQKPSE